MVAAGPLVFAPFADDTDYFGGPQHFRIHLRVTDLAALLDDLAAAGIEQVKPRESMDGVGDFAWVEGPEGNRVELWQAAP
jgi:predicted enzyme related to lactoylglutathione lyase